jgi:hypothetical protein
LSQYPEFTARKPTLGRFVVLADVAVLRDIRGDIDAVDLPENTDISKALFRQLIEKMSAKGYAIDRAILASVGMSLRRGTTLRVLRSLEDRGRDPLPLEVEPFYVDTSLDQDPVLRRAWESVFRGPEPAWIKKEDRARSNPEPSASIIGRALQADTLMIVSMSGRTVSTWKSLGQAALSATLTLGMATGAEASAIGMRMVIVETQSGLLMWGDQITLPQTHPNSRGVEKVIRFVVDRLP